MQNPLSTWALGLAIALLLAACGDTSLACKKDPITGSESCQPVSSSGGEAAAAAGVAAGAWAVAGCTVNGCVGANRCNEKTKMCEPIECDADAQCPAMYHCDLERRRCE